MEIVGLKNFVQDDVNKPIAKFVGFKPHPVAELLKPYFRTFYRVFYFDDNSAYIARCVLLAIRFQKSGAEGGYLFEWRFSDGRRVTIII